MMERFSSKISCSYFLGFPTSNDIRLWQEEFWRARCHTSCDRPLIYSITRTYKDIDWPETIIPWVVFSDSVLDWQEICLFLELVSSYCVTTDHPKKLCGHVSKFGTFLFCLLDSHSNSMSNEFWVKRNWFFPMMFAMYQQFPMDSYERLSTYQPQYQAFSNVKI